MNHQQILVDDNKTLKKKVSRQSIGQFNEQQGNDEVGSDSTLSDTEATGRETATIKHQRKKSYRKINKHLSLGDIQAKKQAATGQNTRKGKGQMEKQREEGNKGGNSSKYLDQLLSAIQTYKDAEK